MTPLDRLLVETDAPFLTPAPHRGQPNACYLVPLTVRAMAQVLRVDVSTLCTAAGRQRGAVVRPLVSRRRGVGEVRGDLRGWHLPGSLVTVGRCWPGSGKHRTTRLGVRLATSAPSSVRASPTARGSPGGSVLPATVPGYVDVWIHVLSRPAPLIAQGVALTGVVAGTVAFAGFDKSVALSVDGHTKKIHAFGSTVADVLNSEGVKVGPHDLVSPAASSRVQDGSEVTVRYGRQLTITTDGVTSKHWTTALTVDEALSQLGLRADTAKLSVSRSMPLGRKGLSLTAGTLKHVNLLVGGRAVKRTTYVSTRRRAADRVAPHGRHARPPVRQAGHPPAGRPTSSAWCEVRCARPRRHEGQRAVRGYEGHLQRPRPAGRTSVRTPVVQAWPG